MITKVSVEPEAYRMRLLNTLVGDDIRVVMSKLGYPSVGDSLDNKYHLCSAWTSDIEAEVLKVLKLRLRGKAPNGS